MEKGKKIKNKKTSKKKVTAQSPATPKKEGVNNSNAQVVPPTPSKSRKGKPSNKNKGK